METPLTVFYTHNLRGNLHRLPRLFTFLRQLRAGTPGPTLLVDLGASCVPEVWPCGITGGRSTLLVLDAMGYHAANVNGVLTPESRAKLVGQVMLALVDDRHSPTHNGISFIAPERADTQIGLANTTEQVAAPPLRVILTPAEATSFVVGVLTLQGIQTMQVGIVRLESETLHCEVRDLPPDTPPDPIIAGVVELVLEEARYFEARNA